MYYKSNVCKIQPVFSFRGGAPLAAQHRWLHSELHFQAVAALPFFSNSPDLALLAAANLRQGGTGASAALELRGPSGG